MKLIIEARLESDGIEATDISIPLAVIERHDDVLEELGLSLLPKAVTCSPRRSRRWCPTRLPRG